MKTACKMVLQPHEGILVVSDEQGRFRYWQNRTLYSIILGYATFYLVRQNFVMTFPSLQSELGYSKIQLGMILSVFSVIYGIGKTISGSFSDRSNARYFMACGLFCSALVNVLMGFVSSLTGFMVLWGLNACFQSMGAPPCARLLTHWFGPREIATKWAIWNISHQVGGALVFATAGYIIHEYGWQQAFFVPAFISMAMSCFLVERLRDTPASMGLQAPHEQNLKKNTASEDDLSFKEVLFKRVFKNKYVWYVCGANFFLYIVRMGVFNWAPTFLREFKGSSLNMAGWQAAGFEVAGIFGGIAAGYLSDRVFRGRRGPVGVFFLASLGFIVVYLWKIPPGSFGLDALALIGVGFLVYGPQVLIGVAATDFSSKKAAGAASGLTGTFGYLGSTIAGVGIGAIVEYYGWDCAFMVFVGASFLGALCMALTWGQRSQAL